MVIKSFVGGHAVRIYADCTYDPQIRKYRGGRPVAEIPYAGRMLNAQIRQEQAAPLEYADAVIPTTTAPRFVAVDPIPPKEECDYCIVSALYVAACKSLGMDTSRLLTISSTPVVDEEGRTIGTCTLNRN
ncbi:MAG: hypothetical protein IJT41_06355 [Clostridia bacterium]|nr:hypothetical protein [Clostridia bacterium]